MPQIEKYDKIAFIFDYDESGYSGWKKIKAKGGEKLEALFYQQDYSKIIDTGNIPSKSDFILVEDFFLQQNHTRKK